MNVTVGGVFPKGLFNILLFCLAGWIWSEEEETTTEEGKKTQ